MIKVYAQTVLNNNVSLNNSFGESVRIINSYHVFSWMTLVYLPMSRQIPSEKRRFGACKERDMARMEGRGRQFTILQHGLFPCEKKTTNTQQVHPSSCSMKHACMGIG